MQNGDSNLKIYSQNNEQQVIVSYFERMSTGNFLDIGAYDGVTFSNTRYLAELGWTGVLVEPSPDSFRNLCSMYESNTRVELVNAAIGVESGLDTFYCTHGDALSTVNCDKHLNKWSEAKFQKFFVNVLSMKSLLEKFGKTYDFVNLDVEGNNLILLEELVKLNISTRLICVEHDGNTYEMLNKLASIGLTNCLLQNGENIIVGI